MNKMLSVLAIGAICPGNGAVPERAGRQDTEEWYQPSLHITRIERTDEAVAHLQGQSPDAVLLCASSTAVSPTSPELDRLKATAAPIILIATKNPSPSEQQHALQAGFANVLPHAALTSPLLPHLLQQTIQIHQQQRRAERLKNQIHTLESAQTQFIQDISHQLRNPLNSVSLYLELLELGRVEKRAQYLDALTLQTRRLQAMIEDIVEIARLDSQQSQEKQGDIDVNNLIRTVAQTQQQAAQANDVTLHYDLASNLPKLYGRYHQLHQAITCLLDNAIKYAPGGTVQITTRQPAAEASVQCRIADSGIGISPQEMPHIFEAYYRGRNPLVAKTVGTGLGLVLAKKIVENHNGRLTIDATPDEGTTATITLPCQKHQTDAG